MKRILPLLLVVCCLLSGCQAKPQSTADADTAPTAEPTAQTQETTDTAATTDEIVVTVNGEPLYYTDYYAIETAYLSEYEAAGVDLTDESIYTYLQDLALTYAIEQMLIIQDMKAQGCYDFDAETEAWLEELGQTAYDSALEDVTNTLMAEDTTMSADEAAVYALAYAQSLNVTVETYVDYFRTQYAAQLYYEWLTKDTPVTDADVQAAYATYIANDEALYANDAAAFETALANDQQAWYRPEGYRRVLQILLPAEGDTDEARLQSVQETVDTIYALLEQGESFQNLITLYGCDSNFDDPSFMETGYQVHRDSVIWEDLFVATAFSEDMAAPGCWSQPFVSDLGVHILYYLGDAPGGPVALTDELYEALEYYLYTERYSAAQTERLNVLADAAEVVFP